MVTALSLIESARGRHLVWSQPRAFTHESILTVDERVLATLRWPKAFGSLAEGRIGEQSWTFKRVGFWRPAVTIRRPEAGDHDVGRFVMDWGRGELFLPGGTRYRWAQVAFWKAEWAFFDATGRDRLAEFVPESQFFKMATGVRIPLSGGIGKDLPLLLLLGWYLLVMASQDDAAATAAIIAG